MGVRQPSWRLLAMSRYAPLSHRSRVTGRVLAGSNSSCQKLGSVPPIWEAVVESRQRMEASPAVHRLPPRQRWYRCCPPGPDEDRKTAVEPKTVQGAVTGVREPEHLLVFPPRLSGWSIVIALGLTTIVSYGTTPYLFGVLEVPLATTFAWSRAELSGAHALSLLVAGILGVPVGYLVDRFGARHLMTVGSVLAGCALIGLAQIAHLWQFYLYWSGGLGIAMALILYPVTFTVVTSWFVTRRAKAFALLTLVGGLASPIFIPLSGWLIPQIGWRATLFWYGVLHLALAVPLRTGQVVSNEQEPTTVADGTRTMRLDQLPCEILSQGIADILEVPNPLIRETVRAAFALNRDQSNRQEPRRWVLCWFTQNDLLANGCVAFSVVAMWTHSSMRRRSSSDASLRPFDQRPVCRNRVGSRIRPGFARTVPGSPDPDRVSRAVPTRVGNSPGPLVLWREIPCAAGTRETQAAPAGMLPL